jgi:hypothetical protein
VHRHTHPVPKQIGETVTIGSDRHSSRTLRRALLPFALLLGLLALAPAGAQAATQHNYCGTLLPPQGWCSTSSQTTLDQNIAWYPGEGNLTVCEEVYDHSTNGILSLKCAVNGVSSPHYYGTGSFGHSLQPYVQNGSSSNAHTVNGTWWSVP